VAGDPAYREILERLRRQMDEWRQTYGDQGDIPEHVLSVMMWPDKVQPVTAPPLFIPICRSNPGIDPVLEGTFKEPVIIQLYCATQGASIAYTTEMGENPAWKLYTKPIRLAPGTTLLRAKAVRIGFKGSEERLARFNLE
jgi:hypothetical protein